MAAFARHNVPTEEVAPALVKKIVTGDGRASKEVLASAVSSLLGFSLGKLPLDASDAVAVALAFGVTQTLQGRFVTAQQGLREQRVQWRAGSNPRVRRGLGSAKSSNSPKVPN